MPDDPQTLYQSVCQQAVDIARLESAEALLGWDELTKMPAAGAEHRAEQMKLLSGIIHQRWTNPRLAEQLAILAESPLVAEPHADTAVNIRRLKRKVDRLTKLPQSLVEELAQTASLGQHVWRKARAEDDFAAFRPVLEKTFSLKRQQADAFGYDECRYDALLDDYEPDERTANVGRVLAELRERLVPLVAAIAQSERRPNSALLQQEFPIERQQRFGRRLSAAIGFDYSRGRLDETAHPFCTGLGPNDCRITTRYDARSFGSALFGTLHESGHGIYDQGTPTEHYGLPLGETISLGIHESQSRLWENLIGRSRPFWQCFYGEVQEAFPEALAQTPFEEFFFAINEVRPSLIRVEADEATYNLHILVRFELEQALLDDDLPVADLPGAWREKYAHYLGIEPPSDTDGVLQDVHWSAGMVGYFPTYALGNLYAAQFFAQADADLGGLEPMLARGEFHPLREWLRENIHRHGQRYSAAELVERVTGKPLSSAALIEHLRAKLGPLYGA